MSGERRAILIGSSQFPADPKLTPLRCPENDVDGLGRLLGSEAQGGYREVVPLKNKRHYEVLRTVNVTLNQAKADDFVLIYYSGHGKLDRAGRLCLAASDTEVEALGSTSIQVETILDFVRTSTCKNVGLILDCCYSGAIGDSIFKGGMEEQFKQASRSSGIYILTASTGVQAAEEKERDEYGLLTKYIIRGIESGEADPKEEGQISMEELYLYVHRKVTQEGFQEPMRWNLAGKGELIVARTGKTPRGEYRRQIRQMLLDHANEGRIGDRVLSQALNVLSLKPDELKGEQRRRDDLLRQLFDKRLSVGEFVEKWFAPAPSLPVVVPHPPPPPDVPPRPPWWKQHLRTVAIAVALLAVVSLVGWWVGMRPPAGPAEYAAPPRAGEIRTNPDDGQKYVWIPPGEFQMGCSTADLECGDDENPLHTVRISRGFWLGQTEVTVGAYRRFAQSKRISMPGEPVEGARKLNPQWSDLEQPMVMVTWTEAKSYCKSWAQGRLPTEAEWERSARAGSVAPRYEEPNKIAWFRGNSEDQIRQVRQRMPNAWGLYDMLGNVWEWVNDWYQDAYYRRLPPPAVDPKGPSSGTIRVMRGGSWLNVPRFVRASIRGGNLPEAPKSDIGFRCARGVIP